LETLCAKPSISALTEIAVSNFRNFEEARIPLQPGLNLFYGQNAQGKSNLLEAIYLLSTTRSFRGGKDKDLIQWNKELACVNGTVQEHAIELKICVPREGKRRASINDNKLSTIKELIGRLPAVCFSSTDLLLARGDPSFRRKFLDTDLSQMSVKYLTALSQYKKSLEHRNALLRKSFSEKIDDVQFFVWEQKLAESGQVIREMRVSFIENILPFVKKRHKQLSAEKEVAEIHYMPAEKVVNSGEFLDLLQTKRETDKQLGHTSVGPQRDDFELRIDGKQVSNFASQGQQRTICLAVKLAQVDYWKQEKNIQPLLLLDDILSDLDDERRNMVIEAATGEGQTVITLTDWGKKQAEKLNPEQLFEIVDGKVKNR
jgi:DNA replication and repair protein RecF